MDPGLPRVPAVWSGRMLQNRHKSGLLCKMKWEEFNEFWGVERRGAAYDENVGLGSIMSGAGN